MADYEAKRRRDGIDKLIADTAAANSDEYTSVFSQLGVEPEYVERFKSNLVALHRQAVAAGEPLRELAVARVAFDKSVRSALGEENYARYRYYEESKPAVREYELLQAYALKEKQINIDPSYSETIIGLINDAGATTTETWHGPYDPTPKPAVGLEMVTNQLNQALFRLKDSSDVLLKSARESGVPDEINQLLAVYFADKIAEKARQLEFLALPEDERRRQEDKLFEEGVRIKKQEQARGRTRTSNSSEKP